MCLPGTTVAVGYFHLVCLGEQARTEALQNLSRRSRPAPVKVQANIQGRPIPTRPVTLKVPRRLPVALSVEEITVLLAACAHLRDRFLSPSPARPPPRPLAVDLGAETRLPVSVTARQVRHTSGTRLSNAGVPQHVVQERPGCRSPQMTAAAPPSTTPPSVPHSMTTSSAASTSTAATCPSIPRTQRRSRVDQARPHQGPGKPAQRLLRPHPPRQDCPRSNACLTVPGLPLGPSSSRPVRGQPAYRSAASNPVCCRSATDARTYAASRCCVGGP